MTKLVWIKNHWIIIFLIIIFGLVKLPYIESRFKFETEHTDDFRAFEGIWQRIKSSDWTMLPIQGQVATYSHDETQETVPIYHGVFYYYFHIPVAALTGFVPTNLLYVRIGFELLSVLALYLVAREIFKSKIVAGITGFFYICLYWTTVYSRYIWTPSMVPVFTILGLYGYIFRNRGLWHWFAIGFGASAASQVQVGGYWLFAYFACLMLTDKVLPSRKQLVAILVGVVIPLGPTLFHEIRNGFSFISYFVPLVSLNSSSSLLSQIGVVGESTARVFQGIILGSYLTDDRTWIIITRSLVVGIVMMAGFLRVIKTKGSKVVLVAYIMLLPMPWLISSYYLIHDPGEFDRILETLTPIINNLNYALPFVALNLGAMSKIMMSSNVIIRTLVLSILSVVVYTNIGLTTYHYYGNWTTDYNAGDKILLTKAIASDSSKLNFELNINESVGRSYEWLYLFSSYTDVQPERFNGELITGHLDFPIQLRGESTVLEYKILDRRYDLPIVSEEWSLVYEAGIYEAWRREL